MHTIKKKERMYANTTPKDGNKTENPSENFNAVVPIDSNIIADIK